MRIIENIKTFLYDKKYFVNIFDNYIHVYSYLDLEKLTDTEIILKMEDFSLIIIGSELHVTKMAEGELMIKGILETLRFKR